jgi:hypothetical protein
MAQPHARRDEGDRTAQGPPGDQLADDPVGVGTPEGERGRGCQKGAAVDTFEDIADVCDRLIDLMAVDPRTAVFTPSCLRDVGVADVDT